MKVAILDDYADSVRTLDAFGKLDGHDVQILNRTLPEAELATRIADREALVLIRERTRVGASLLERLPMLRLIVQTARIGPHVDVATCQARGVAVAAGSGSPQTTAELTLALMLAAMRGIVHENRKLREGHWQTMLGRSIRGRTVGIHGYGKIGRLVAKLVRAFGAEVLAFGREQSLAAARDDGIAAAASARALYAEADIVSLHLRLVPETRGLVNAEHLAAMRPDSLLVNTARAELIAPDALLAALESGRPAMAALDVFEGEPAPDRRLIEHPRVLATPHLGYVEKTNYEHYFGEAFDHVNAFAAGTPTGLVTS